MKEIDREAPPQSEEPAEGGGEVAGACVVVPDGEYEIRYMSYETAFFFGSPKVTVHCSIVEHEDFAGLPVDRFYNVTKLTGPPGRFGNYIASARGDLVREYGLIVREPSRRDRISFQSFNGKRIVAELETVNKDYRRNPLPQDAHYSRISRFLRVLPGDEW